MGINPANLPDPLDATPEYGLVRTVLFFGLYVVLIVAAVVYVLRKLPRGDDILSRGKGEEESDRRREEGD